MKQKQGRVRNYVVSNREKFCDYLATSLCKMQIQYVQVGNEFHFNDKIYRFYNFDECLELNGQVVFVSFDNERLVSLNPQGLIFARTGEDLERYLDPISDVDSSEIKFADKRTKKMGFTKQMIRQSNKEANQRIKNSYKQQGFRNRRNG